MRLRRPIFLVSRVKLRPTLAKCHLMKIESILYDDCEKLGSSGPLGKRRDMCKLKIFHRI